MQRRRDARVWIPSLFALLGLTGLGLALTHLHGGVGPYGVSVRGRPAPWYPGALLAVFGLTATLVSLWWYRLPDWERRRAALRTEVVVAGRRVPVLMFPYSTTLQALMPVVGLAIVGLGLIGGSTVFLLTVAVPALVLLIRVVFGRQFIGLTPGGLAWRAMPPDSSGGGPELQSRDVFTRQPVQFLPWEGITAVALADVTPTRTTGGRESPAGRACQMLKVSVSDPAALAGLAHYQRVVPTEAGADVLIPLDRHGPRARLEGLGEAQTRAEPEAVLAAVEHYLRHPEERGQIGTALGEARSAGRDAAPAPPAVEALRLPPEPDPRAAARRVGGRAYKAGSTTGGAALGLPYFALVLALLASGHAPGLAQWFLPVTVGYMLLVVLPGCAALSGALAAFAAPAGHERAAARAAALDYVVSVTTLAVMTLSLEAWQYFDPRNPGRTTISIPLTLGALVLTVLGVGLGGIAGLRAGLAAKEGRLPWLARRLGRWGESTG